MHSSREIVITGMGVVSPLGIGLDAFRAGLASRKNCVGPLTRSARDAPRLRERRGAQQRDQYGERARDRQMQLPENGMTTSGSYT